MKKDIIRINDKVIIKNPEIFIRCGYPMSFNDAVNQIEKEYKKDIDDLIAKITNKPIEELLSKRGNDWIVNKREEIYKSLGYCLLKSNKFGGYERKIHSKFDENYSDKIGVVIDIKRYNTGIYQAASGGYDYYNGGYEYEPPCLLNQKNHKILTLQIINSDNKSEIFEWEEAFNEIRIESCHVEKLKD
jgi:hypothetical protein